MGLIRYFKHVVKVYCVKKDNNYYVEDCKKYDIDSAIVYKTMHEIKAIAVCNYMNNVKNPLLTMALKNWRKWK